ncbi:unnamed protein product [Linum tenue]|uniref:beta-glucosidase n=1 Tax=Linum tenue TaxID=586396 RepID=A0AAV0HNY7_9ROSI|nr:unnamed protein product [Linum tenue]
MASTLFSLLAIFIIVMAEFVAGHDPEVSAATAAYKDPSKPIRVRINDLMERMSLSEKIGQMTQIDRSRATTDVMSNYCIGSVLSVSDSVPGQKPGDRTPHNFSSRKWIMTINKLQEAALATRLGIPMLYAIDAVHGHNYAYRSTIFPHNVGLGATRDPQLVKRIGAATALEARATGVRYVFSPTIAVCRDPRWGRCYESYSEDPALVKLMTETMIAGLEGDIPPNYSIKGVPFVETGHRTKVAACAKHFVGDGGTSGGVDRGNAEMPWKELAAVHLPPYSTAILKGVASVMLSYSSWNGQKMHANRRLVTGLLKTRLKFRGFVISDFEGIDKIKDANYSYSVEAGISAGIDMVMAPYKFRRFIRTLTYQVEKGIIPMTRIDDAVARILRVKFTMGLFENPYADVEMGRQLGSQEHRELAREAVRKSLVLLKNDGPLLPLPKYGAKILVAGTHANNLGYQCGGWTMQWQGQSGNNITQGTTILSAIASTVDPSTEVLYSVDPSAELIELGNFSHAIVVVGEVPYAEFDGDNGNLTIPEPGLTTISNVCDRVISCVVVLVSGRPLVLEPHLLSKIHSLVAAWLPGTEGQGVADLLFGDWPFTGRLPRTWFKRVDQLPMNVGDRNYLPLFPFGFGLT